MGRWRRPSQVADLSVGAGPRSARGGSVAVATLEERTRSLTSSPHRSAPSRPRPTGGLLGVELPGSDDPVLHAVTAIRWGVLIFGLSLTSAASYGPAWGYATATALLVFNASWRTIRPVVAQAGTATSTVLRVVAPDLVVALLAAGATAAWSGPYALAAAP
ncbi:hypothetical protein B7486_74860, partial [cyanobacterium TDX16]